VTYGDVDNDEDIIDSRDVIARIDDIRSELADLYEVSEEGPLTDAQEADREDLRAELAILEAFAQDGYNNVTDWEDGATLIRESYFTEYAEELADDIGAIDKDAGWPLAHIDWDAAADALKIDYVEIDFDGVTYLAR
jgi:hypothetical protein